MGQKNKSAGVKRQKMLEIISDLKKRIVEMEIPKTDLDFSQVSFSASAQRMHSIVSEIKVPELELIKDEPFFFKRR